MGAKRVWSQQVTVEDGIGYLRLSHPDGRTATHLFSPRLFDEVIACNWHEHIKGYAQTKLSGFTTSLHALAMNLTPGRGRDNAVDHIDRNSRNSQDYNLRLASIRMNAMNRADQSRLGTGIATNHNGFLVQIAFGAKRIFTPSFKTIETATQCRDVYLVLAREYDLGSRALPTKEELQIISTSLRN